jgi:hypothetical protein
MESTFFVAFSKKVKKSLFAVENCFFKVVSFGFKINKNRLI